MAVVRADFDRQAAPGRPRRLLPDVRNPVALFQTAECSRASRARLLVGLSRSAASRLSALVEAPRCGYHLPRVLDRNLPRRRARNLLRRIGPLSASHRGAGRAASLQAQHPMARRRIRRADAPEPVSRHRELSACWRLPRLRCIAEAAAYRQARLDQWRVGSEVLPGSRRWNPVATGAGGAPRRRSSHQRAGLSRPLQRRRRRSYARRPTRDPRDFAAALDRAPHSLGLFHRRSRLSTLRYLDRPHRPRPRRDSRRARTEASLPSHEDARSRAATGERSVSRPVDGRPRGDPVKEPCGGNASASEILHPSACAGAADFPADRWSTGSRKDLRCARPLHAGNPANSAGKADNCPDHSGRQDLLRSRRSPGTGSRARRSRISTAPSVSAGALANRVLSHSCPRRTSGRRAARSRCGRARHRSARRPIRRAPTEWESTNRRRCARVRRV